MIRREDKGEKIRRNNEKRRKNESELDWMEKT